MLDVPDHHSRRHPPVQKRNHRPDEDASEALRHRRHLALICAACIGLALATASGLALAWQIDRWLADWHYRIEGDYYVLPEAEQQPSASGAPEVRL